jgi:hypothetical protein
VLNVILQHNDNNEDVLFASLLLCSEFFAPALAARSFHCYNLLQIIPCPQIAEPALST